MVHRFMHGKGRGREPPGTTDRGGREPPRTTDWGRVWSETGLKFFSIPKLVF